MHISIKTKHWERDYSNRELAWEMKGNAFLFGGLALAGLLLDEWVTLAAGLYVCIISTMGWAAWKKHQRSKGEEP